MTPESQPPLAMVVPLQLKLDYQHGLGDLTPYFLGLDAGILQATVCKDCDAVWLPPRLTCTCGSHAMRWMQLGGTGTVLAVTQTISSLPATTVLGTMTFALVKFDGATNQALVRCRVDHPVVIGLRVRLAASTAPTAHPVQKLEVVPE